jgi:arsenite methyltransferase
MSVVDTEELAKGYTVVNSTQFDAGLFLLNRLGVALGNHVLDVGCGPGNLTAQIVDIVGKDGRVIGIDPSKERIALAMELEKTTPNLTFFEGKAEDLSRFPSGSIDVVFVNSTFHWVQDQPAAVREFARVLKSGGRLGISGGSGDYVAAHEKIKADVLSREPYRNYPEKSGPKFIKQRDLESLLDDSGFSERKIVINTIIKSAKDGEAMIEWLDTSSSGATYGGIPLDLRPKAREEMKQEWAKITTADGIRMEMELLVTVAVKD